MTSIVMMISNAHNYSKECHKGQKYGDEDYFEGHVLQVAYTIKALIKNDIQKAARLCIKALLHDIKEDCSLYSEYFILTNFGKEYVDSINILTFNSNKYLSYQGYLIDIANHYDESLVKFVDAYINLSKCIKTGDSKRGLKYFKSMHYLNSVYNGEFMKLLQSNFQ